MIRFQGMSQAQADGVRAGGLDSNGQKPERQISDGEGVPCRCCMTLVPAGREYLILGYRPFETLHPYAETGPVFLCAEACTAHVAGRPEILASSPDYLLKAYSMNERIIYGTGQITAKEDVEAYAATLLEREDVAFVDIRSARNNCWLARVIAKD